MNGQEISEVLRSLIKILRAQIVYMRRNHESYLALYDALRKSLPDLQSDLRKEMETIREVPEVQSQLDLLDELLERLERLHQD